MKMNKNPNNCLMAFIPEFDRSDNSVHTNVNIVALKEISFHDVTIKISKSCLIIFHFALCNQSLNNFYLKNYTKQIILD